MKSINYLFFLLLILIPLVNASVLTIENENPQPSETIVGTISSSGGIDTTLTKTDLKFYKNGILKTPQEYDIHFYNGSYYFYFIFAEEGNYTLIINQVTYKTGTGMVSAEDINRTLEIKRDNESSVLQIKPGVVYGYSNFFLDLINKGNNELTIKTEQGEIAISSGDSKRIQLEEREKLSFFEIETYKTFLIPIISLSIPKNIGEINNESDIKDFSINNEENLDFAVEQNKREDYSFSIKNLLDEKIDEIEFTTDLEGLSILNSPSELENKSTEEINVKIKMQELGLTRGNLIISYVFNNETKEENFPINIYVSEEKVNLSSLDTENNETCIEMGIPICSEGEDCSGGNVTICEGATIGCVGGTCIESSDDNPVNQKSNGWVAALIIILVIGVLAFVVFNKYKKVK